MGSFASNSLERSLTPNLLDSRFDHDSCGVGFVATLRNQPSHEILTQALTALARLAHRGAIAADGKSSDGVGIMTAIPREFLLASTGLSLDPGQPLGVGVVFFPEESGPGQQALEQALAGQSLDVLTWRVVPTREAILGEIALSSIPVIRQVLITAKEPADLSAACTLRASSSSVAWRSRLLSPPAMSARSLLPLWCTRRCARGACWPSFILTSPTRPM